VLKNDSVPNLRATIPNSTTDAARRQLSASVPLELQGSCNSLAHLTSGVMYSALQGPKPKLRVEPRRAEERFSP